MEWKKTTEDATGKEMITLDLKQDNKIKDR